jgi:tetratricopeptide (TPR) repeat protein
MRRWVVLASLLVSTGANAQAVGRSSLSEIFENANLAASRGNYAEAISGYRSLIEAGVRDSDVYFNLGTVSAQSGHYPRAILNYERALAVRPNDGKTRENLRNAEKTLEEQRAEAEGEAMIQRNELISDALYGSFTEDALAYLLLLANLCFFGCLAWAWILRRRSVSLVALSIAAGILLLSSAFGLAVKAGMLRDGPRAVALDDRVALRDGPDERARVRGETRGGDRALVVGADRDFLKLRVAGGLEGWVPAASVGLVDLDEGVH